jgi:hypothetical protein
MKRPAFLDQSKVSGPGGRAGHRAVNLIIAAAICALWIYIGIALFNFSPLLLIAILTAGAILSVLVVVIDVRRHRKKLKGMKFGSWLGAVRDRDIGHDVSANDPATTIFLREKFEAGCSPYEALAEWRHRKAEANRKPLI